MTLRRARLEDVEALLAIEQASFSDPWSRYALATSIESPMLSVTVAELAAGTGTPVGYSVLARAADEAELLNLAVVETARGCGVGTALVEQALDDARAWGAVSLFLEVRESNAAARQLYQRTGFAEVARRKGYYRRPSEDALILRRLL